MRARKATFGTGLIVALTFLAACGSSSKSSSDTTSTTASGGGVTVADPTGTTVHVTVNDTKGLDGPMTLTTDTSTAPAGDVTFVVKNTGTVNHEVVVLTTPPPYDQIPITSFEGEANRVDEASSVGETTAEVKPGESNTFTVKNMAAGGYALVCNLAKHYGLGMRGPFTVT
jgi:uncharacterized cupredoxin-like copper-binding protein